jgi:RNA-binding protein NOB1
VKHLVVDAGAFIKHAKLHNIGETVYTIADVVSEVRDKATREQLQVLPYDLKFREPTPEAVKIVTEFARKTGDLHSLSATDIRVLALVYTLEKELVGVDHIRTQPSNKVQWVMPEKAVDNTVILPGFYLKKNKKNAADDFSSQTESETSAVGEVSNRLNCASLEDNGAAATEASVAITTTESVGVMGAEGELVTNATAAAVECGDDSGLSTEEQDSGLKGEHELKSTGTNTAGDIMSLTENDVEDEGEEDSAGESDSDEGDDDDDDGGWITPGNLAAVKQATAAMNQNESTAVSLTVACITTDYAMQNVLVQMGLHVISVNGMLIRRTTSKILRCYGCFKVMPDCEREFCSNCGNKTLSRVTVAYNDDGTVQYFLSRHKKFSTRGLRYSLPLPRGGKYSKNPVVCEDQREAQKRTSKQAKVKVDVFDTDYTALNSPFAPIDIHSRSAMLGYISRKPGTGQRRRNPNENRKNYGHRK